MNSKVVNEEKFNIAPDRGCFNDLLKLNFSSSGLDIKHSRGLASAFSALYNELKDPDFEKYISDSNLDSRLALTLGDLGLLLYVDLKAGSRAVIVQGLTSSACGFAKELIQAGTIASTDLIKRCYLEEFSDQQRQSYGPLLPVTITDELSRLQDKLIRTEVNVISQFQFYRAVFENQGVPEESFKWHEGWLTARAVQKLTIIKNQLEKRADARTEHDNKLLDATNRMLNVNQQLKLEQKEIDLNFPESNLDRLKKLAQLFFASGKHRNAWQQTKGAVFTARKERSQNVSSAQL